MVYCTNCGKELKDDAVKCIYCGHNRDIPDKGNTPSEGGEKLKNNDRSFKYSVLFYSVIILDILTCLLFGWAWINAYLSSRELIPFLFIWIMMFNLIIDTVLLNNIRKSPNTIDINWCWIKSLFGFLGLFTIFYGLYFLIISLAMRNAIPVNVHSTPNNSFSKFWYNKGVEFTETHEYEHALEAFNQALSIDEKDPDSWNNKCYVLIKLGRYEEAIQAGEAGVKLAPNDPVIWDTLRNAYLANHNPEKAALCENKKSSLQPESAGKKQSDNTVKTIEICFGLIIFFFLAIAIISNWESSNWGSFGNNLSDLSYWVIFLILLAGIIYEGWKAIKQ